jgi:cytochrome c oxidase subunit 2
MAMAETPLLGEASSVAGQVDRLLLMMLLLSGLIVVGVTGTLVWFAVKYRRGSPADRSVDVRRSIGIELTWTLLPLAIFLGLFVWSIDLFARMETPPPGAAPVYVIARQWMWKVQHPEGQREINQLHVPLGVPVRLLLSSEDVIHSFYVPAFRLKQDVLPQRYTQLWFQATAAGEYHLFCSELCGTDHARMGGKVIVMRPADYARWLEDHRPQQGLAVRGAAVFREYGCSGCHEPGGTVHAPPLEGLYGKPVHLSDGSTVTADESYIRDSVLLPAKQVVAGYAPIMPSFSGQISEEDLLALIAYLKTKGDSAADGADGQRPPP